MQRYRERYQIGPGDSFWLAFDRDAWKAEMIASVAKVCKEKGIGLAVSNPSFEVWIALHFEEALPADLGKISLRKHLVSLLGSYKKAAFDVSALVPRVQHAIDQAQQLDVCPSAAIPDPPGSRVYMLMQAISAYG